MIAACSSVTSSITALSGSSASKQAFHLHSTILNIKGDSFRLKDKKKAGLVPIGIINKQEDNLMT